MLCAKVRQLTTGAAERSLGGMGERITKLDALRAATVYGEPFAHMAVRDFIRDQAVEGLDADCPVISLRGSFPIPTVKSGEMFRRLVEELREPEFTEVVGHKLNMHLAGLPTMVTYRGWTAGGERNDGRVHVDDEAKVATALLYLNPVWDKSNGRLRLLHSDDLEDVVLEVPPIMGSLVIFKNAPNAFHGYTEHIGHRRAIQLNWMTGKWFTRWEIARHTFSAYTKQLRLPR